MIKRIILVITFPVWFSLLGTSILIAFTLIDGLIGTVFNYIKTGEITDDMPVTNWLFDKFISK